MKASDAKQFIGVLVQYKLHSWPRWRRGVVSEIQGRNIFMDDDVLWAPDVEAMEEVNQKEVGNASR